MAVLHVHTYGPEGGPPVVVIHGVTNTGARFRRLSEEALPGAAVYAPDLRGHAHSTREPPWSVERHVDDLVETMDAHGIVRATLVGHSFGGLLATHLAAAHPHRVTALALLDPAIALPPAVARTSAEAALTPDAWAGVDEARAAREALRPPHSRGTVDEDLSTFLVQGADGLFRLDYSAPCVVAAWGEMARPPAGLGGFPGEVLLVEAGQADFVTDALRAQLAVDLGDRLEHVVIDAGHMLFWDAFDELSMVLQPFVERSVRAPAGERMGGSQHMLYDDLTPWYHLVDPPDEHAEEVAVYLDALRGAVDGPCETLLELGSGAGNNAVHIDTAIRCTLVDLSPRMLELSRVANPECEHHLADMRTVRLGRTFDAVLVHDAVTYMTSEYDLARVIRTAYAHTRPGGAAVIAPEATRESFQESSELLAGDDGRRALRGIEWSHDPDPDDCTLRTEYALLLREGNDVRFVHDRHVEGLFPEATWRRLLEEAGFEVSTIGRPVGDGTLDRAFLCRRR